MDKNVGTVQACQELCRNTAGCYSIATDDGGDSNCKGLRYGVLCPYGGVLVVDSNWREYYRDTPYEDQV